MAFNAGQITLIVLLAIMAPIMIYYWYKFATQSSPGSISGGMRMISKNFLVSPKKNKKIKK